MTPESAVQETRPPLHGVFHGPWGVRAGWRIALWMGAFLALTAALFLLVGAAGVRPGLEASTAVELVAALASGWAMLAWVDRRPPGALGYAADLAAPRDAGLGFALGGAAIALA